MKKIKLFLCVALFGAMSFGAFSAYEHYTMSDEERFLLANIEALTQDENQRPPEWWDYFNNYEVEERIPINSSNCYNGSITIPIKGIPVQINIGSCENYSIAIYHHCYDGGSRDECTSSHLHTKF